MALDRIGLQLVASRLKGASVLCLGYPDITVPADHLKNLYGIAPERFTGFGRDHKVAFPLPETVHTLKLLGATEVECVDFRPSRGVERTVDLNTPEDWARRYEVVINPGTLEHCFEVAKAMFNAWRAVALGGVILHAAPMTMLNHGFWNFSPTVFPDFAQQNGGRVLAMRARDGDWKDVPIHPAGRFRAPAECVLYALIEKVADVAAVVPTQRRYQ